MLTQKPTYRQQFDKLTEAYIKNHVHPFSNCACFVGNLLNGAPDWCFVRTFCYRSRVYISAPDAPYQFAQGVQCIKAESADFYSVEDIIHLENTFMGTLRSECEALGYSSTAAYNVATRGKSGFFKGEVPTEDQISFMTQVYEDALFKAFEAALGELKKIHISKGEDIEEITFQKRIIYGKADVQTAV